MGAASSAHAARVERQRDAVAEAELKFASAILEVSAQKRALVEIHRASQRKASIIAIADWRHGVQWRRDRSLAYRYAAQIAKAILWELSKDNTLGPPENDPSPNAGNKARLADAKLALRSIVPALDDPQATAICRRAHAARRSTNRDVGAAIDFTWDEYLALRTSGLGGKVRQIWPADIPADEFVARRGAVRREEDAVRKTISRKARGCRTAVERAANEAAKREWVEEQAKLYGRSPRTIRERLTKGEIAYPEHLQSAVRGIDYE